MHSCSTSLLLMRAVRERTLCMPQVPLRDHITDECEFTLPVHHACRIVLDSFQKSESQNGSGNDSSWQIINSLS